MTGRRVRELRHSPRAAVSPARDGIGSSTAAGRADLGRVHNSCPGMRRAARRSLGKLGRVGNQRTVVFGALQFSPIASGEITPHDGMSRYSIIHDGLKAYGVEVVSPNRFLSVRGFATEREAAAWVAERQGAEAMLAAANPDAQDAA